MWKRGPFLGGGGGGMRQGASSCSCRAGSESAEAHLCQTCAKTPNAPVMQLHLLGVMCLQHWCIHSHLRAGGTLSDDNHLSARFRAYICPTSLCSPPIGLWYGFASCDLGLILQLCVKVRLASASPLQRNMTGLYKAIMRAKRCIAPEMPHLPRVPSLR